VADGNRTGREAQRETEKREQRTGLIGAWDRPLYTAVGPVSNVGPSYCSRVHGREGKIRCST